MSMNLVDEIMSRINKAYAQVTTVEGQKELADARNARAFQHDPLPSRPQYATYGDWKGKKGEE